MDYKEKYEQALERCRKLYNEAKANEYASDIDDYETIFPELRESDDERIRKEIVRFIQMEVEDEIVGNKWLAWLEKQGEQKPANKVEPKFKVGDWITNDIDTYKIIEIDLKNKDYIFENGISDILLVDNICHLWTIQDAKDGDVLHSIGWHNDCIFIFNGLDNWKFDEPNGDRAVATGYCCLSVSADNMEFGIQGPDCIEVNTVKPATKIQRDLLFQKMKENGYEWDAEKKELKKIEQKSAWSEEDEKFVHGLIRGLAAKRDIHGHTTFSSDCIDITETISWLKSLKDRVQLKPTAWSEEDEVKINRIVACLENLNVADNDILLKDINWLKDLKDRVQPQPKQEWSEEDKKMFSVAIRFIKQNGSFNYVLGVSKDSVINWLKSLKDKVQPKPIKTHTTNKIE